MCLAHAVAWNLVSLSVERGQPLWYTMGSCVGWIPIVFLVFLSSTIVTDNVTNVSLMVQALI